MSATPIRENAARGTHDAVGKLVLARHECERLLDVPCGAGAFTKRMLDAGRNVVPVDCVDLLEVAHERFRRGDMNARLPAEDGEFDAVVSIDGIEHIERQFDFVAECARVLRPGGRLFLSTPNVSSLRSRWRWLWTGFHDKCKAPLDWANPSPLHHISMLDLPKLWYMLRTRGFRVVRVATNRVKAAAWLYLPMVPIVHVWTRLSVRREIDDRAHAARSDDLLGYLLSFPAMFGEILIVEAVRD